MPDFSGLKLVDKLLLRGCKSLLKVHQSIGQLTKLSHLDLGECTNLKELTETIGQLTKLIHLDLGGCVTLKRPPEAIKRLTTLCSLNLKHCRSLTRLPEQLGDMNCLKMLDASYTSIELLPDSIGRLKELVDLRLYGCKKLFKLPEQIGNMESLKLFDASYSAIEELPDTFSGLVNLGKLHLFGCENLKSLPNSLWKLKCLQVMNVCGSLKLKQLPEELGKMQRLVELKASETAIEVLPNSIGQLCKLQVLDLGWCKMVRNIPSSSIGNLTSLSKLCLYQENMDIINLPDMVKDMKLKSLELSCKKLSSCLPVIPSFFSLKELDLFYEGLSFSSNEQFSLSKLSNLQYLTLNNRKSSDCSFPELPLNLIDLSIDYYETLEMLPDLLCLKQLKSLHIWGCSSLQLLPPLPPHLLILYLYKCTSLQDLPDMSMLKELNTLRFEKCMNLKSISWKQSFLQVKKHKLITFEADTPEREVAEWFSYKSSGDTLSFTIPPNSDYRIGIGVWIVYKCEYTDEDLILLTAVITNKTKGFEGNHDIWLPLDMVVGEVQSMVQCKWDSRMKSGDRIKVSFHSDERVNVNKCGAHLFH